MPCTSSSCMPQNSAIWREGHRGVVDQPDGGGAGHDRFVHRASPRALFATQIFPGRENGWFRLEPCLVFGEVARRYSRAAGPGKEKMRNCLPDRWRSPLARRCRPGPRASAPGAFDYYVLSLQLVAELVRDRGRCPRARRNAIRRHDFGWVLHGLWPQDEDGGYPSYCRTRRSATRRRAMTAAMADIMGTDGAAWYQWKKHGRCSGLTRRHLSRRGAAGLSASACCPRCSAAEARCHAAGPAGRGGLPEGQSGDDGGDDHRHLPGRPHPGGADLPDPAAGAARCGPGVQRDCTMQDALMEAIR